MRIILLALLFLPFVAGCVRDESKESYLADHCAYLDVAEDRRYCGTTMIEIMSSPRMFEAEHVLIRGWVVRVGNDVFLVPFPEYYDAGFSVASIVVDAQGAREEVRKRLLSIEEDRPTRVSLGGRFEMVRGKQPDSEMPRLGRLHEISYIF